MTSRSGHATCDRVTVEQGADMGGFMDKAKDFADQHDEQVDQGLEKAGDVADQRTGGGHTEQIDRGVDRAQERTGEGDTQP
jgi:MT0933-like antitoxin protein